MKKLCIAIGLCLLTGCARAEPLQIVDVPLGTDGIQTIMQGLYEAEKFPDRGQTPSVPVAIVPHHLTAAVTIAAGIHALAADPPRSILLLSPDHFSQCPALLCTGNVAIRTSLGTTQPDAAIIDALRASPLVTEYPQMFAREHGIHAVTPFITTLLPNTRVTPLVIDTGPGWYTHRDDLLALLHQVLSDDVTLVVSSDFSHYLSLQESDAADERTAKALFSKNFDGIAGLDNPAQSDCPPCLWLAATIADEQHAYNPSVLLHTNSARLLNELFAPSTTSHFAIAFYKNAALSGEDAAFGGDVTVTRAAMGQCLRLSEPMQKFWDGDGPRIVNLEGPLQKTCGTDANPFIFCNALETWTKIQSLATHWSVENNHMLDQGEEGYEETHRMLMDEQEFPLSSTGTRIGKMMVYGLTNIINPVSDASQADLQGKYDRVIAALRSSKDSDVSHVVFVHSGTEYHALTSERERMYLRSFVDAGANTVIATHTHVQSDMEMYNGAPIFRGIGNFLFDQYDAQKTSTAKAVRLRSSGGATFFETLTSR